MWRAVGYDYIHSAVDHHPQPRLPESCTDERGETAAAGWRRAAGFLQPADLGGAGASDRQGLRLPALRELPLPAT